MGCAAPKVDKNQDECVIFVYRSLQKWGARCARLESRTKSPKIEKMFYSVTFAKTVRSQIAANLRNQRFARNQGQVQ